jgi:hypothetical protein
VLPRRAPGASPPAATAGGPIFVSGTNIIAAVTSISINQNCAGTRGGYRVDTDSFRHVALRSAGHRPVRAR